MSKADVMFIALVLVMAFLFEGDPDVWDVALERVKYELAVQK